MIIVVTIGIGIGLGIRIARVITVEDSLVYGSEVKYRWTEPLPAALLWGSS